MHSTGSTRMAILGVVMALPACAGSQPTGTGTDTDRVMAELAPPRRYTCYRATTPVVVDGMIDDEAWRHVPWTHRFMDIEGPIQPLPPLGTWAMMVWDDENLYIAAVLEEPHVTGSLTERDQIVFHDNDFEVFIDPDGDTREYYEVEINALNTIFDLFLHQTYIDGGPADHDWDLQGLQHAVRVEGTINDASDRDTGWTLEFAMPWSALGEHANRPAPPRDGDVWRINFSRVEWSYAIIRGEYRKLDDVAENNWVWSPQGVINMHVPERWGYLEFRDRDPARP